MRHSQASFFIFLTLVSAVVNAQFSGTFDIHQMAPNQGLTIEAEDEFTFLGRSISAIGDFNHDGFNDIVVSGTGGSTAAAYVIYGGSFQPDNPLNITQLNGGNGFALTGNPGTGVSVSHAGDFNGDGVDDLLVAANFTIDADMDNAIAYVLFGNNAPMLKTVDLNQMAPTEGIKFNRPILNETPNFRVSGAGDFNGDGFDDIMIGSPWSDDLVMNGGAVYVVYGNNSIATSAINLDDINGSNGFAVVGHLPDDPVGFNLAAAGNFNDDQFDDVLIAVSASDDGFKGYTYLLFGQATTTHPMSLTTLDGSNGVRFIGDRIDEQAGNGLGGGFDFNHDGIQDILIGAPFGSVLTSRSGLSYLIFGTTNNMPANFLLSDVDGNNGVIIDGLNANGKAGDAVAGIGDFNGDLIDDVIMGGPESNGGWSYVIYGTNTPPPVISTFPLLPDDGFRIRGTTGDNRLGSAVAGAGDFNGDGLADALIGANRNSVDLVDDVGTVYVLYGDDTLFKSGLEAVD